MAEKKKGWLRKTKSGSLTASTRQGLPKSDFALPGKGEGPKGAGSGSYPIPDEAHARAALSRGAANASPSELASIKRKVHEKYPGMEIKTKHYAEGSPDVKSDSIPAKKKA